MTTPSADIADPLRRLECLLESRRGGDPEQSYTARLLARGVSKCAQKLGEEAVETAIAAVEDNRPALIGESADLLFHLVTLWLAAGVSVEEVAQELKRRESQSGLEEKAGRGGGEPRQEP